MGPFSHDEALQQLIWDWGDAYAISRPEPGVWLAQRRDDRATLRAETAGDLHDAIAADYGERPVPRDAQ